MFIERVFEDYMVCFLGYLCERGEILSIIIYCGYIACFGVYSFESYLKRKVRCDLVDVLNVKKEDV